MESLAVAIVTLGLSGITLMAYRHPPGYAAFFGVAHKLLVALGLVWLGWQMGLSFTMSTFQPVLMASSKREALAALSALQEVPALAITSAITGLLAYLYFLRYLPEIFGFARDRSADASTSEQPPAKP